VKVTRSSEIRSQETAGVRVAFVAGPDSGASESVVLRGFVTAGEGFSAHSHDREEIFYVLSGAVTYTIAGETGSLFAGDVIAVPAGALHAFEAKDDLDAIAVLPAGYKTFAPDGTEMPRSGVR
jgi:quercetin dioxygenase-like cupin family protein